MKINKINQVQIENYKSFAESVVNLEKFTVLVGPNGSGKSNFVEALRFIKDCLSSSIPFAIQKRGEIKAVRRQDKFRGPGRPLDFGFRLIMENAEYSFEITAVSKGDFEVKHERCIVWRPEEISSLEEYEREGDKFTKEVEGIKPQIEPDRLALTLVSGVKEFRPVYDFLTKMQFYSIAPEEIRKLQGPDAGEVLKEDGSNSAAVLRQIKEKDPETHELICRMLSMVVPGITKVEYSPFRSLETLRFEQEGPWKNPRGFYASNMSDGTLRVLGILLAVYQPSTPSLIAIEEPEATIHPGALEVLVDVLKDGAHRSQVLLTTHSPYLIDDKDIKDEELRVVEWSKGKSTIGPLDGRSRDIINKHLFTPGELLWMEELEPDKNEAEKLSKQLDLFGKPCKGKS